MIYILLIAYILFTFWGSLLQRKLKNDTPDAYFLANRNVKTLTLFFTIIATNMSAFYFLGFAGEGYRVGYVHYFVLGFGSSLATVPLYLLGKKVWQLGKKYAYITPGELIFGQTKHRPLTLLFSGIMCFYTLPYMAVQIIGGGYILANLSNGTISYEFSVILLTIFTILYVVIGGMESVAKTDLKQGAIMIVMMFIALFLIASDLGGVTAANSAAFAVSPELFSIQGAGDRYFPQQWVSFTLIWFFSLPVLPQLFMRYNMAKDLKHFKQSAFFYGVAPFILHLLPVCIGVWGVLSFPELVGKEADQILPLMLQTHTNEWFAALIMIGAIAAFMSTLDSQLLALSTMITRDFYIPFQKKKVDLKQQVWIGRLLVIVFALLGLFIAFNPFDTLFEIVALAFAGFAILFPITMFTVFWGGTHPLFGMASILIGQFIILAFFYEWIPKSYLFGFESYLLALIISFLLCLTGKWIPLPNKQLKLRES